MDVQTKRICFKALQRKHDNIDIGTDDEVDDETKRCTEDGQLDNEQFEHIEPCKEFSKCNEIVLIVLSLFYVVDIGLDIWVAARFFTFGHPKNGWFVLFCILVPNLYAGYKSLQWYLRAHDFEPIRRPLPWIIRVSFFPISLLLRYYDTWKFGRRAREARMTSDRKNERLLFSAYLIEATEAAMLRLFTVFLEDAAVAVLNLKEVILTPPHVQRQKMHMVIVVMFKLIFTMTISVVHYLTSIKSVYHAAKTDRNFLMGSEWAQRGNGDQWENRGFLSVKAQICLYGWHICSIGSRLVSYAMFVAAFQNKLWILVGVRWIINTIWIKIDAWDISLNNCVAYGGVYLFTFVPTSPKRQLIRVLLYYTITLIENTIVAVLFSFGMRDNPYGPGTYGFVFGGTSIGMVMMILYYSYFHPTKSSKNSFIELKNRMFSTH